MVTTDFALLPLLAESNPACRVIGLHRPFTKRAKLPENYAARLFAAETAPTLQATMQHLPFIALACGATPDNLFTPNLRGSTQSHESCGPRLARCAPLPQGVSSSVLLGDCRQRHFPAEVSDALYALAQRRTFPAGELQRLCDDPRVAERYHFVALHTREHLLEYPLPLPRNISQASCEFRNFADTVALMQACDAVITIDTCIANAGAMLPGVPTTVLLSDPADWRYGMHSAKSPWLQGVDLLRVPRAHEWDFVTAQLLERLIAKASR